MRVMQKIGVGCSAELVDLSHLVYRQPHKSTRNVDLHGEARGTECEASSFPPGHPCNSDRAPGQFVAARSRR